MQTCYACMTTIPDMYAHHASDIPKCLAFETVAIPKLAISWPYFNILLEHIWNNPSLYKPSSAKPKGKQLLHMILQLSYFSTSWPHHWWFAYLLGFHKGNLFSH